VLQRNSAWAEPFSSSTPIAVIEIKFSLDIGPPQRGRPWPCSIHFD
jgi:hypothetical protein